MIAAVLGSKGRINVKDPTREMLAPLQRVYRIRIDAHHWKCIRSHSQRCWDSWGDGTWPTCNTMAVPCQVVFRYVQALKYL